MQRDAERGVVRARGAGRPEWAPGAFERMVERHGPAVRRLCSRCTRDAADAEDAYQETLLRLLLHIDGFRLRCRTSTWIHRVALNACRDLGRRRAVRSALSLEEPGASGEGLRAALPDGGAAGPHEAAAAQEVAEQLGAALGRLPEALRRTLVLRFVDGLALTEAARVLGVAEGTVKSRQHRAVAALERLVPHLGPCAPRATGARARGEVPA